MLYQTSEYKRKGFEQAKGYYIWWAMEKDIVDILQLIGCDLTFADIKNELKAENFDNQTWYAIYIGIASNLSNRLYEHINGNIFASTLRKSLSGIHRFDSSEKLNKEMMKLRFSYTVSNDTADIERKSLTSNFYLLNLLQNNHKFALKTKYEIRKLRKEIAKIYR